MADFSHLKALAVTSATTKEYTFDRIEGEPSVIVAPATDDNEDYLRARLELALADVPDVEAKPKRQSNKPTVADLEKQYEEQREIDRKLLAKACCRGWGETPPVDKDGKAVEFSEANAYDFFAALPDYMFDPFRNYCGNVMNFAPRPKPDGEKLGNS